MDPITPDSTAPSSTSRTVVAFFKDRVNAESAVQDLRAAGFTDDQLGIATRQEIEAEAGRPATDAGSTAVTGAASGGVLGGLVGLLAGAGALVIPGLGPVLAGGILTSILAGAGIGAAAGGVIGALMGMGVPEEQARRLDTALRAGGTIVAVSTGTRTQEAIRILEVHQGDVGQRETGHTAAATTSGAWRRGYYDGPERRHRETPVAYAGPERRQLAGR